MAVDIVRDSYDAKAGLYAEFALGDLDRVPTDRDWLTSLTEIVGSNGGLVADLGCGPGYIVNHLAEHGLAAVGYDISPAMIAEANRAFPGLNFKVGDLCALDSPDSSLGGIISRYSLIHMHHETLGLVFEEWSRVLTNGAPILVSFFAARTIKTHGLAFDHAITTGYASFPEAIRVELERVGFVGCEIGVRQPLEGERQLEHGTVLARCAK